MRRKLSVILLSVLICMPLSGCRYSHEITEMAYAVALGLDKADEGITVSVQFARPLSISGGSGGGGESSGGSGSEGAEGAAENKNTTVLTVSAKDFYTALSAAENSLSKEINLSHIKLLLFSETLAQDGVSDYVTLFMKNSQFSPNTYTAISLCSAEEYMRTANPSLEINPAKYYTLIFSNNNNDYMPATTLRELYFNLSAPGQEPVLPVANLSKENDDERNEKTQGDYFSGELSVGGENRTDVSGMAVLSDGKLKQVLSTHDAVAYHILTGKLRETYISMPSVTDDNKNITLRLTQDKRPKLCADELGDAPQLSAKVYLLGELVECPDSDIAELGIDGLNNLASDRIKAELESFLEHTKSECRADVVGFGKRAKMQFCDWSEWLSYDWQEHYARSGFNITANVNISREGLVHVG